MSEHGPKCPDCGGWGFVPDRYPLEPCAACGGSGKPPKEQELLK